jgi:hypothetical protein
MTILWSYHKNCYHYCNIQVETILSFRHVRRAVNMIDRFWCPSDTWLWHDVQIPLAFMSAHLKNMSTSCPENRLQVVLLRWWKTSWDATGSWAATPNPFSLFHSFITTATCPTWTQSWCLLTNSKILLMFKLILLVVLYARVSSLSSLSSSSSYKDNSQPERQPLQFRAYTGFKSRLERKLTDYSNRQWY